MALRKPGQAAQTESKATEGEVEDPELAEANVPPSRAVTDSKSRFKPIVDSDTFRPRLMVAGAGGQRSGKTHFGLTMPKSRMNGRSGLAYFAFDKSLEGTGQHLDMTGVEKVEYNFQLPVGANYDVSRMMSESRSVKNQFASDLAYAIRTYRSIFIDTGTWLYALLRLAHFGKLNMKGHHYAAVNAEFREWLRMIQNGDPNFYISHRLKDEWKGENKTGRQILAGFGEVLYECQITIQHDRNFAEGQTADRPANGPFIFQVTDCTQNPDIVGQWFEQPDSKWQDLAMWAYPGEDSGIWL